MSTTKERLSPLTHLSLVEAAEGVQSGAFSAVDLTEASLDAFSAGNKSINAAIALEAEERVGIGTTVVVLKQLPQNVAGLDPTQATMTPKPQ